MLETDNPFRDIPERVTIFDLLNAEGVPHRGKDSKIKSPIRDENTPSFSIFRNGLKWKDHTTGEHGDIFDLWLAMHPGADSKEAIHALAAIGGMIVKTLDPNDLPTPGGRYRRKLRPEPLGEEADPSRHKITITQTESNLEIGIGVITTLLANKKGIAMSSIRRLVLEGSIASTYDYGLAYIMQRGIKGRPKAETSHGDFWIQGKGSENVFRGEALLDAQAVSDARLKVVITEGETDCMVLQDEFWATGVERSFVLGAHGGSWVPDFRIARRYLRGREVFIIGDNDQAGDDFSTRLQAALKETAGCSSVSRFSWTARCKDMPCKDIGEAREKNLMEKFISSLRCKDSWL